MASYLAAITPDRRAAITQITVSGGILRAHQPPRTDPWNPCLAILGQCTSLQIVVLQRFHVQRTRFESLNYPDAESAIAALTKRFIQSVHRLRSIAVLGVARLGCTRRHGFKFELDRAGYKFEWHPDGATRDIYLPASFQPLQIDGVNRTLSMEGRQQLDSAWRSLCSPEEVQMPVNPIHLREFYQQSDLRAFGESRLDPEQGHFVSGRTRSQRRKLADPAQFNSAFFEYRSPPPYVSVDFAKMRLQGDGMTIEVCIRTWEDLSPWMTLDSCLRRHQEESEATVLNRLIARIGHWCSEGSYDKLTVQPHLLLDFVKDRAWADRALERDTVKRINRLKPKFALALARAQAQRSMREVVGASPSGDTP